MKLIVKELTAQVNEQVFIPTKNTIVEAIRPHLVRFATPTGTLKLQIYKGVDMIAESQTLDIADIAPGASYFHGFVRFFINAYLEAGVAYKLRLVGGGG